MRRKSYNNYVRLLCKYFNKDFLIFKKHLFCQDCINTWLFKKKNNCPICRIEVNMKEYKNENNSKREWDVVEFDKNDFLRETNEILEDALNEVKNS